MPPVAASAATLTASDLMDMPLEQLIKVEVLVTGASKYAEKTTEAPSIVEVLTAEDIRTYGWRTLGDAINGIHGVFISNDRNHSTTGVRGYSLTSTSNSRVLVMIDGHRMNENVYDSAYVGREFLLDMDLVDHIEYIPGPGSSIYGANAMMGVINVVTKKGSDIDGTEVSVAGGTLKTGEARATYGKKLDNGTEVLLSASGFYSGGNGDLYYPVFSFGGAYWNFGHARDLDAEYSQSAFAKVQSGNFTYTGGYVTRNRETPTGGYSTYFGQPGYYANDDQLYGEVKYHRDLNDRNQLDLKAFYHRYDSVTYWPYDCGVFICPYASSYNGNWAGAEATYVTTAIEGHKIVVGAEFQYDFNQHLFDYFLGAVEQDTNRSGIRSGFYAQDAITLNDKLTLNAGLRVDQHHMIKRIQINPRLGLVWNPQPSTTVKLLYGSAFRAPDAWETDYDFGPPGTTDPDKEQIRNYEAAVEWRGDGGVKLSGSVFYNVFEDMITKDYNVLSPTYLQYLNTGNLESVGFDFGAEKEWDNGREIKLNFNHSEYIVHEGTNWGAVDAPKNVAKLRYAEPLFGGRARLGVENIFVDKRLTIYYTTDARRYIVTNAVINSSSLFNDLLPAGTDVTIGAYNLFDSPYEMTAGPPHMQDVIPMNGRNFLVTFRKTF